MKLATGRSHRGRSDQWPLTTSLMRSPSGCRRKPQVESVKKRSLPSGFAVKGSPTEISCHSGWILSALRRPKLSSRSHLYQPPRSTPICTSHGQTCEGAASIVTAIVAVRSPPGMSSAPG